MLSFAETLRVSRGQARQLAAVLVIVSALVGALELGARYWRPPPAPRGTLVAPPPKAPGTFRIFTMGSSVVFGLPAPALGLAQQLEFALARALPERDIEIINLAIPGRDSKWQSLAVAAAMQWEPDLVFLHTGWGEFLRRDPPGPAERVVKAVARRSALVAGLYSLTRGPREDADTPDDRDWLGVQPARGARIFARDSAEYRARVDAYRANLETIADRVQAAGVPLLLATVVSNLSDWPPSSRSFVAELYPGPEWREQLDDIYRALDRAAGTEPAALAAAQQRIDAARSALPDDGLLWFFQGKLHQLRGEFEDARRAFVRARDADPTPWRVSSAANEFLRSLTRRDGIALVDLERALEANAPGGLVGFELVSDIAHLTPEGHAIAVHQILQALAQESILFSPGAKIDPPRRALQMFLSDLDRRTGKSDYDAERYSHSAIFAMRYPYDYPRGAHYFLSRLVERTPRKWEAWAQLGATSLLIGREGEGRTQLERAIGLRGGARGMVGPFLQRALDAAALEIDEATGVVRRRSGASPAPQDRASEAGSALP